MHSLGLKVAQGLVLTEAFYWDLNDGTRAWSRRFAERHKGRMPTMVQAGVYAGMMHYLKAVKATGSKDPATVTAEMRRVPAEDPCSAAPRCGPTGGDPPDVPVRGEEARRVEGPLGLLPPGLDHPPPTRPSGRSRPATARW